MNNYFGSSYVLALLVSLISFAGVFIIVSLYLLKSIHSIFYLEQQRFELCTIVVLLVMESVGTKKPSTMICAPIMAQSVQQMVSNMHQAKAEGADLVEIRLDCIEKFQPHKDLEIILRNKPLPVLIVYRYHFQLIIS